MTWEYQQSPLNPKIIERRLKQEGARWGFYKVTDSPKETKRILKLLNGEGEANVADDGDLDAGDAPDGM